MIEKSKMFKNRNRDARRGFTLIEILVVVAIIAILSSVILIGLGPTRKLARDARRIADLRQVQNGLEIYFNRCGAYPGGNTTVAGCTGSGATTYPAMSTALVATLLIQALPTDPSTPNQDYVYAPAAGGRGYTLGAQLEDASNPAARGQITTNGISCGSPAPNAGVWYCVSL